jgi:transposase-like protein
MVKKKRKNKRYSLAFKQKVIQEIESGRLTAGEAQKLYGIGSNRTIDNWLEKYGKGHLINRVVRIESTDEVNRLKVVEKEKQRLESALAQAHLKILSLETMISKADEFYNTDIKKNFATTP